MVVATAAGAQAAAMQPFMALNRNSAKLASFTIRVCRGRLVQYEYRSKRDGSLMTGHKFEAWLVGSNAEHYCIGFLKGSKAQCEKAKSKYHDDSICILSNTVFDTFTKPAQISTPIVFRVDLEKSTCKVLDTGCAGYAELYKTMPTFPVPPRSVAEVAAARSDRSTDVIAMIKSISTEKRKSKNGDEIVDVELVDASVTKPTSKLAEIVVSIFGADKIKKLSKGATMVFFNLSVTCGRGRDAKPSINHYPDQLILPAPQCKKTKLLQEKQAELESATDTDKLTAVWTPTTTRDVSGEQALGCAAFLDMSSENLTAALPGVIQVMWGHLEEPDPDTEVVGPTGDRLWFRIFLRDVSGAVSVGIPQRCAVALARCSSMDEFKAKHAAGTLNFPLLCQARVSRTIKDTFVNHTLEMVEPVSWHPSAAPNKAFCDVLAILNCCPPDDQGIHFAFLADVIPDPIYGFKLVYDGEDGPTALYVAALIASGTNSKTEQVGEHGFKVVTTDVKDVANPAGTIETPVGSHALVGYCSLESLPGFRLDPPRNKPFRYALALFSRADEDEGFQVHKLEPVEPDQVTNAVHCMRKLRGMSKAVHPVSTEKRTHAVDLSTSGSSPSATKKARTLHNAPTDASWPGDA